MYMTREEFEKVLARNVNSDGTGPKLHCISRNRIPFFPNDLSEEYKSHVHARSQLCWNLDSMKDLCAPEERHVLTSETSFLLHCSGIISHVKVIIPRHLREFTCESELFGAVGAGDVGPEDVVDEASGAVVGDTQTSHPQIPNTTSAARASSCTETDSSSHPSPPKLLSLFANSTNIRTKTCLVVQMFVLPADEDNGSALHI